MRKYGANIILSLRRVSKTGCDASIPVKLIIHKRLPLMFILYEDFLSIIEIWDLKFVEL